MLDQSWKDKVHRTIQPNEDWIVYFLRVKMSALLTLEQTIPTLLLCAIVGFSTFMVISLDC